MVRIPANVLTKKIFVAITVLFGEPLVEKISQRCEIIFALCAVDPIIDGNEADTLLRKCDISIRPCLQIVPAKAGHILDDHSLDFACLDVGKHPLKARAVERNTRVPIIEHEPGIWQMVICGEFLQNSFLILYAA